MRPLILSLGLLLCAGVAGAQDGPASRTEHLDAALAAAGERAAQSVVRIEVERPSYGVRPLTGMERRGLGVMGSYDPRYFSRPDGPVSGVVVAPQLIATAQWNLEGDGAVTVVTHDGRRLPAKRLGRNESCRVALLRVEEKLQPIARAEGEGVIRPGRFLLLVGRTASGKPLVTRGIVSGLDRYRGDAFTHSARTSFANTGGALVDMEGKLIGIATRHGARIRQGQSSGVGFGAPVPVLWEHLDAMARGEVIPARPTAFLGISSDQAYPGPGVKIGRIVEGTAAQRAGLRAGDVISIFNSVELLDFIHLTEEIQKLEVGAEIVITFKRGAEERDLRVKLGKRPPETR